MANKSIDPIRQRSRIRVDVRKDEIDKGAIYVSTVTHAYKSEDRR